MLIKWFFQIFFQTGSHLIRLLVWQTWARVNEILNVSWKVSVDFYVVLLEFSIVFSKYFEWIWILDWFWLTWVAESLNKGRFLAAYYLLAPKSLFFNWNKIGKKHLIRPEKKFLCPRLHYPHQRNCAKLNTTPPLGNSRLNNIFQVFNFWWKTTVSFDDFWPMG